MNVDDPVRQQWERIRPRTAEERTAADQDADPSRPDPASLHAGAMPYNLDEPIDPIRAWLDDH